MTRRIVIGARAETDITDAAIWYQKQRAELGEEFIAEVNVAIKLASENPRQYRRLRRRPEVRRVLTQRFPYRVFYLLRPDAIVVFRVLHAARDDAHWKKAIPEN
jgi:plasmid stabilization system protein ParE